MKTFLRKLGCTALLSLFINSVAFCQTYPFELKDHWVTDGFITSSAYDSDNRISYWGGLFSHVGPLKPNGAILKSFDLKANPLFPAPNDAVHAMVSDGSGGWFIGGDFTKVGNVPRQRLARINGAGEVLDWNPGADGEVLTLLFDSLTNTVYVGGDFQIAGGKQRSMLAAIDANTGIANSLSFEIDNRVKSIQLKESRLFIGGSFGNINGVERKDIARLNLTNNTLDAWNPMIEGITVDQVLLYQDTLFVIGDFDTVGGVPRLNFAAINPLTSALLPLEVPAAFPRALHIHQNRLYLGKLVGSVSSPNAKALEVIDLDGFSILDSNIFDNATSISAITSIGNTLYFSIQEKVDSLYSPFGPCSIVAMDAATNTMLPVTTPVALGMEKLVASGNQLFAGGDFNSVGGVHRSHVAAVDLDTGLPTSWAPILGSAPSAMVLGVGELIVYGLYEATSSPNDTVLGSSDMRRFAAIDLTEGFISNWNLMASNGADQGRVNTMLRVGNVIYAGGKFDAVDGLPRGNVVAFDASTKALLPWDAEVSSSMTSPEVHCLDADAQKLFIGGEFTHVKGAARNNLAAVSRTSAQLAPWNPNVGGNPSNADAVLSMVSVGDSLFIGGVFSEVSGESRANAAAVTKSNASLLAWSPEVDFVVSSLAHCGTSIYACVNEVGPQSFGVYDLVRYDMSVGNKLPWNPFGVGSDFVFDVYIHDGVLFTSGKLIVDGVKRQSGSAAFRLKPPTAVPPCLAFGGTLTTSDPNRSFCVGEGGQQGLSVTSEGAVGSLERWGLIDSLGNIVANRGNNSLFNLSNFPPGDYTIRYMRYEPGIDFSSITNISQIPGLDGCFGVATNSIEVFLREKPLGGAITALSPTTICSGSDAAVEVTLSGNTGTLGRYGVVDFNDNLRIVRNQSGSNSNISLSDLPPGSYGISHMSYEEGVSFAGVEFPSDLDGCFALTVPLQVVVEACAAQLQALPNPGANHATLSFTLPENEQVRLEVFDMSGRLVQTIFQGQAAAEIEHRHHFDASHLPNGVYLCRLITPHEVVTEKWMLAR